MPVEIIERPVEREAPTEAGQGSAIPPPFGRCPVCGRPLRPRCRYTDELKMPPIGEGILSRAKCDGCGSIIEYVGNGEWVPWMGGTDEDETK